MVWELCLSLNSVGSVSKNRCSLDIVRAMLSIASVRVRKTKIMYGANLSFHQVEKYLSVLLSSGLLEHDVDSGYLITEAGRCFLVLYEGYLERSNVLREEVERNTKDRLRLENMCFNNKIVAIQTGVEKDDLE
jgi:predicted transcriptional regulator